MLINKAITRNLIQKPDFLLPSISQIRFMTIITRVKDRSQYKRIKKLEKVKEKHRIISKFLFLFDLLKREPENVILVKDLDQYREKITLPKPHSMVGFLEKSPKLFELCKDERGRYWCGLTPVAESLLREEEEIIAKNSDKAAEYVTRMLMMAVDKRLALTKVVHFRRDIGLPIDFRVNWVHSYPELFKVVNPNEDEGECLELVRWRPEWAITELERKQLDISDVSDCMDHVPGLLSLAFPMKFPRDYKKVGKSTGWVECFQKTKYLSPYADVKYLVPGTREYKKRAVAVMHELLSFTIEKRLVTDHLTHFRKEFSMPQKLMRLLLRHFGIFYVSEKGKRYSVFLTEAYRGSKLIEKHPLVMWREKLHDLIGYRKKKPKITTVEGSQVEDDGGLPGDESEDESDAVETEGDDDCMSELEGPHLSADDSEMAIDEIDLAYKD